MANRLIRSPQYITQTSSSSTVKSAKLEISIGNTLRYTLIKDAAQNVPVLFEWSELARDYLDITWNGTDYSPLPVFDVDLALKFYPEVNAGGTQIGSTYNEDHNGFDGYGDEEGFCDYCYTNCDDNGNVGCETCVDPYNYATCPCKKKHRYGSTIIELDPR